MSPAWRDGTWLEEKPAGAWWEGSGLLTGDGLFETLRADRGALVDPLSHAQRLQRGLDALDIDSPESAGELLEVAARLARRLPYGTARVRVTVARRGGSRPPLRLVHAGRYEPPTAWEYETGVSVLTLRAPRLDGRDPLSAVKSLSWGRQAWAARHARERGAYEALLLNVDDRLAEASRCNVVVRIGGRLVTPPISEGCLPGTVRRRLLETGRVHEEVVESGLLGEIAEMLLTNSLVGVLPVASLDGRPLDIGSSAADLRGALSR